MSRNPREACVVEGTGGHGAKEVTSPVVYRLTDFDCYLQFFCRYWFTQSLLQEALLTLNLAVIPQPPEISSPRVCDVLL